MAISFVSVSAVASDGANDDVTITAPTGIQEGDLLLAFYETYVGATGSAAPVALSGFTTWAEKFQSTGGDTTIAILYKIASGSEPGSYNITGSVSGGVSDTAACMMALRGVDQTTPIDVTYVEGSHYKFEQNTSTPTPQSISVATEGAWAVVFAVQTFGNPVTASVPPTGYDERVDRPGSGLDGQPFNISTKLTTLAGNPEAPDQVTFTDGNTTDECSIFTIAVRPAATSTNETVYPFTGPWR